MTVLDFVALRCLLITELSAVVFVLWPLAVRTSADKFQVPNLQSPRVDPFGNAIVNPGAQKSRQYVLGQTQCGHFRRSEPKVFEFGGKLFFVGKFSRIKMSNFFKIDFHRMYRKLTNGV